MNKKIEALKRLYRNDIKFLAKQLQKDWDGKTVSYMRGKIDSAKEYLAEIEDMEKQDEM